MIFFNRKLPHWLLTETSDVCLFVSDLKKGKKIDHEPTIQHYEDLLRSKGVTKVNILKCFKIKSI